MAGEVSDIRDAHQWSISQVARAFKMDRKTVAARLQEGGIRPAGKRNGYPVYALKDVGPALFSGELAYGAGSALDPADMMPKDRKDWFQSENERLKFEESMGQLIPVQEVHKEMASLVKAVAQTLTSIPDLLERTVGLTGKSLDKIDTVLDGLRDQLYQSVVDEESEDNE